MRIGLDGFPLVSPKTGVGHYTFELAKELARLAPEHSFELIAPAAFPAGVLAEVSEVPNLKAVTVGTNLITRRWWTIGLPHYARRAQLDLFHGTNYEVPLGNRRRNVVTIHDLSVLLHPDKHDQKISRRARRRLPIMVRNAARIITPTEAVKREVCERFKFDPALISVTPEAPRKTFQPVTSEVADEVRRRLAIDDDFVLFVGTIEPRKNLLMLLRAFEQILPRTDHPPQLVIAGGAGWLTREFDRFVADGRLGDRLRLTGYLHDDDLRALYSSCKVFVYPSLYEGFGLPPLEAMACGAPVVASRIAASVETLDDIACFVEPSDVNTLADTIARLLESPDERRRIGAAGLEHAAKFSWQKTAELTLNVYGELMRERL